MKVDRHEGLYKAVRTLSGSADFPRSCKTLLRVLQKTLSLRSLSLHLLDDRRRTLSRNIPAARPLLLSARPLAGTPEATALRTRQPAGEGDVWFFPLFDGRHKLGVLRLQTFPGQPLPPEWSDLCRIAGDELARLLRSESLHRCERQRLAQLTLLSELNSVLNRVGTLTDLVEVGFDILVRRAGAAGLVLSRPGEDTLAASRWRFAPALSPVHQPFLALATDASAKAAACGRPLFRLLPAHFRRRPGAPAHMLALPLRIEERALGTLTLFGSLDNEVFPPAPGSTADDFFATLAAPFAYALERLQAREHLEVLSRENDRKLRETMLLYRISRAIHSTLNLNELMHLILSVAVAPKGGGFERAMLFTVNERTETLQGILCVTRETALLVVPQENIDWERPVITAEAQKAQRDATCCKRVMKERLPMTGENALARCVRLGHAVFEASPATETAGVHRLAADLDLGPFACAPLAGRDRALGVLLVDNPLSKEPLAPDRRRFFEMFASQAGAAMENSMLLHRLETAHQDLRETQARLIHGEKMATLGEMAASIAHELRNPLVPIGGFADRLGRLAPPGSREQQYTDIIIREVRRMEEMLANILVFSKKQMLCFRECRIDEVIEEALHLEAEALARGDITVVREIAGNLPLIHCDDQKLRQVLINLITNAHQAMPNGGILTVRASRGKLRGEDALEVEVADSGSGIPAEVMRNMFNPFFTTKEKGTGLGLSISHRIIEHHRGEIEVKNLAQGVVFILRLPTRPIPSSQH